jgi:hypothetical protein
MEGLLQTEQLHTWSLLEYHRNHEFPLKPCVDVEFRFSTACSLDNISPRGSSQVDKHVNSMLS